MNTTKCSTEITLAVRTTPRARSTRSLLRGALSAVILCALGCDSNSEESTAGTRPAAPELPAPTPSLRASTAPPGAILRFPGRSYETELTEDKLILGAGSSSPSYHIEPLDGGFMEAVNDPEERTFDVYVRPLSRYRVSVVGDGCGASLVLRSPTPTRVTELDALECVQGGVDGRVSTSGSASTPLLEFDLSTSREQLVLHDGEHLFLLDESSSTRLPITPGVLARPRFVKDVIVYPGAGGIRAYDTTEQRELEGVVPMFDTETLQIARAAPVALGGSHAFTWRRGTLELLWSGSARFPSVSKINATGTRIAYSDGEDFIVEGIGDESFQTSYPLRSSSGEITFTRDGLHEIFLGDNVASYRGSTIAQRVLAVSSSGESRALLATQGDGFFVYDFEARALSETLTDLQASPYIEKAQGFPGVIIARDDQTTYVIDADNELVAHELSGQWRPFELGGGRLLLVSHWDLPPLPLVLREFPLCGDQERPCSMILFDSDLTIAWSSEDVTGGPPLGRTLSSGFVATGRWLDDRCTPSNFKGRDGVEAEIPGGVCHVQRMHSRFFQAPCMPFSITQGPTKGVYCAR